VLCLIWGTRINLLTIAVGMGLGICGQFVLVRWAKADPLWFQVYLRSLRYKPYYRAHSGVRATSAQVRPSVPKV
jgi:type IV secretory pathway TrbD component